MNLLDAIPGIGKILDNVITSDEELQNVKVLMRELDIRELETMTARQGAWLSNDSLFVSGAIPSLIWVYVLVIFFNFIIAPFVVAFGIGVPELGLPDGFTGLVGTVVALLLGKKTFDANEIQIGTFKKPARNDEKVKAEAVIAKTAKTEKAEHTTKEEVDARINEMFDQYNIKK